VRLAVISELLFGRTYGHFGWVWLNFSLIFVFAFGADEALKGFFTFGGKSIVAGQITAIEETNTSVNDEPVFAVRFAFTWDSVSHGGASYSTDPQFDVGEAVDIEVTGDDLDSATIEGMRNNTVPLFVVLLVLLFPAIGLALVCTAARRGWHDFRLLRTGVVAFGEFQEARFTGVSVNDVPVKAHEFAFEASGQRQIATGETHTPGAILDESREPILYSPDRPDDAMPFDLLKAVVEVDADGSLSGRGMPVGLALFWPLAFIFFVWLGW
jgi:hypothetical protein